MSTKLDMNFANGIKEGVNALILEVQRLETLNETLEKRNERLTKALIDITKASFAGPNTDERREWIWATARKALSDEGTGG